MGWVTHFGADDWSWNLKGYDDDEVEGDGSGMPGVALVAAAIFCWLGLQQRCQTISNAAETFSLSPELIREAVELHDGLWIDGEDRISRKFDERLACLDAERGGDRWDPDISLSGAISVWAALGGNAPTVETAAVVFMIPPERVRQAIDEHYWMFIGAGDVIEHDGD